MNALVLINGALVIYNDVIAYLYLKLLNHLSNMKNFKL